MITVQKDILSKAIGTASKAVGANPIIPLLSNILFESNNGNSRVAATNLEIGISYTFPSKGDEWKTCIPAKTIASLIDALSSEEIDLELDSGNQSIIIMTDSSTSNIHCTPADEFPDIFVVNNPNFELPVAQFKEMIQRVAFASSADPNSNLGGVQISASGKRLSMFAVDGYHLSFEDYTLPKKVMRSENIPFIIKGTTLEMISRILPDEGDLQVQAEGNKAMFHCGDVDIITQLMSGEFPSYERLRETVPQPTTTFTVPTMELMRAARLLRVFVADTGRSRLDSTGMLVRYSAVGQERGDSDVTLVAVKIGENISIGINVHLLYEFLEVCKTEYVKMELAGSSAPIVLKMQGFDNFFHFIMPIAL